MNDNSTGLTISRLNDCRRRLLGLLHLLHLGLSLNLGLLLNLRLLRLLRLLHSGLREDLQLPIRHLHKLLSRQQSTYLDFSI